MYRLTIRISSEDTIRLNTNTLFASIWSTIRHWSEYEANIQYILNYKQQTKLWWWWRWWWWWRRLRRLTPLLLGLLPLRHLQLAIVVLERFGARLESMLSRSNLTSLIFCVSSRTWRRCWSKAASSDADADAAPGPPRTDSAAPRSSTDETPTPVYMSSQNIRCQSTDKQNDLVVLATINII